MQIYHLHGDFHFFSPGGCIRGKVTSGMSGPVNGRRQQRSLKAVKVSHFHLFSSFCSSTRDSRA